MEISNSNLIHRPYQINFLSPKNQEVDAIPATWTEQYFVFGFNHANQCRTPATRNRAQTIKVMLSLPKGRAEVFGETVRISRGEIRVAEGGYRAGESVVSGVSPSNSIP